MIDIIAIAVMGPVVFALASFWPWWLHDKERTAALICAGVLPLIPFGLILLFIALWLSYETDSPSSSVESGGAEILLIPFLLGWLFFTVISFFAMLTVLRYRARKSETANGHPRS